MLYVHQFQVVLFYFPLITSYQPEDTSSRFGVGKLPTTPVLVGQFRFYVICPKPRRSQVYWVYRFKWYELVKRVPTPWLSLVTEIEEFFKAYPILVVYLNSLWHKALLIDYGSYFTYKVYLAKRGDIIRKIDSHGLSSSTLKTL